MVVRTEPTACGTRARWCSSSSRRRWTSSATPTATTGWTSTRCEPERYGAPSAAPGRRTRCRGVPAITRPPESDVRRDVAQPVSGQRPVRSRLPQVRPLLQVRRGVRRRHQNTFAIAVAGRGFDARISTEFAVPLPDSACVYCGNCIAVCPTGALMVKREFDLRAAGTWNESAQTGADTICPYCGVGCTLTLHVQDNEIVKATSPLGQRHHDGQPLHQGPVRVRVRPVAEGRRPGREGTEAGLVCLRLPRVRRGSCSREGAPRGSAATSSPRPIEVFRCCITRCCGSARCATRLVW